MKSWMTALVLLGLPAGSALACDEPTTNEVVAQSLRNAVTAYQNVEVEDFRTQVNAAAEAAACLSEPITPQAAAEFHRVRGLLAFVDRDRDRAEKLFAAARVVEPSISFPKTVVPEGNAVLTYFSAYDPPEEALVKVPPPKVGSIRLDGGTTRMRFETLPITAQFLDNRGAVTQTLLLKGGESMPAYEVGREGRGPNLPLLLIAGAFGAASGASAVVSNIHGSAHNDTSNGLTKEELQNKRRWANSMFVTSAATGTIGAGFGVAAFVKGRW